MLVAHYPSIESVGSFERATRSALRRGEDGRQQGRRLWGVVRLSVCLSFRERREDGWDDSRQRITVHSSAKTHCNVDVVLDKNRDPHATTDGRRLWMCVVESHAHSEVSKDENGAGEELEHSGSSRHMR